MIFNNNDKNNNNNNNNNNNTYIAPISALKIKILKNKKQKTLRLQKVHEPTNKSENNFVNPKL